MTSVAFLVRRTGVLWIGALSIVIYLAQAFSSSAWHQDAGSAVNWATSGNIVVLPLVFAAASHDSALWARRNQGLPSLALLGLGRYAVLVGGGYAVVSIAAWLLAVAVCLAVVGTSGTQITVDPVLLIQAPAVTLALAFGGAALGLWLPSRWTPLFVGIGYFILQVVAEAYTPFSRFLAPLGFTGWSAALELDPLVVFVKAGTFLFLAAGAVVWCFSFDIPAGTQRSRSSRVTAGALAIVGAVLAITALFVQEPGSNGVRPVQLVAEDAQCLAVSRSNFCTYQGEGLAEEFVADIADAVAVLGEPFPISGTYVDDRSAHGPNEAVGLWSVGAPWVVDGEPDPYAAATTLSRPVACEAYFDEDGDFRVVEASAFLTDWVATYLTERDNAGRAELWEDSGAWPVAWSEADEWREDALESVQRCDGDAWAH